jgi:predicted ArsR family transcriptional regulator
MAYRLGSNGKNRGSTALSEDDARAELDHRILCSLNSNGRKMTARELAGRLDVAPRRIVGRLQALKRQGTVAYTRKGAAPSAPGLWTVTEREGESL